MPCANTSKISPWDENVNYKENDIIDYYGVAYIAYRSTISEEPILSENGAWGKYTNTRPQAIHSSSVPSYNGSSSSENSYRDTSTLEEIQSVLNIYTFKTIKLFNSSEDSITSSLLLSRLDNTDLTITWESSDTKYLSNMGKVSSPSNGVDVTVELKLTISLNHISKSKIFNLRIKAQRR